MVFLSIQTKPGVKVPNIIVKSTQKPINTPTNTRPKANSKWKVEIDPLLPKMIWKTSSKLISIRLNSKILVKKDNFSKPYNLKMKQTDTLQTKQFQWEQVP